MANDLFASLLRFGQNVTKTAHAVAAVDTLKLLLSNEENLEACAKELARAYGDSWREINSQQQEHYIQLARVVLDAQHQWYREAIHSRLKGAVLKGKKR